MSGFIELEDIFDEAGEDAGSLARFNQNQTQGGPISIIFLDQLIQTLLFCGDGFLFFLGLPGLIYQLVRDNFPFL